MSKKFFITGLPRSRTAWLSALLCTDRSICLHEPINEFQDWVAIKVYMDLLEYKYVGVSDSSMAYHSNFISKYFYETPIVVVERNESEVIRSVANFLNMKWSDAKKSVEPLNKGLNEIKQLPNVIIIDYEDLDKTETIKKIWKHCVPELAFDEIRLGLFQRLMINQHKMKVILSMKDENIILDNTN